jgi:uncharacterized coiled-coil DUF342 family protein
METSAQLTDLQAEHDEWQSRIRSYKEEIDSFNSKLEEVVQKDRSTDKMAAVEHFQNQFIRQNEVLDIMRHDFKQHENLIESATSREETHRVVLEKHPTHREELDQFEKIFSDLRKEFAEFASA